MSWASILCFLKRSVSFAIHKGPLVGDIETYGTFRICACSGSIPAMQWRKTRKANLLRALRFIAAPLFDSALLNHLSRCSACLSFACPVRKPRDYDVHYQRLSIKQNQGARLDFSYEHCLIDRSERLRYASRVSLTNRG